MIRDFWEYDLNELEARNASLTSEVSDLKAKIHEIHGKILRARFEAAHYKRFLPKRRGYIQ